MKPPETQLNPDALVCFSCNPARVAGGLVIAIGLLIVAGVLTEFARWNYGYTGALFKMFNLDAEKNLPALSSGLLMLMAAMLIWLISRVHASGNYLRHWQILSAGMVVMAIDEVFTMHERLIEPVQALIGQSSLGIFKFSWVVPALLLLPILGVYFYPFVRDLPPRTRSRFVLSAALFLGGCLGMEMVGGWYFERNGSSLTMSLISCVEETLEFSGIGFFIYAAVSHLAEDGRPMVLRFVDSVPISLPTNELKIASQQTA